MEAVKTNVAGSDNVISACVANHVKKAIFLSTDKAAYPINAMGMTKAVMEKNVILLPPILQAETSEHPHSGTDAYKPPDDPQSQDALES